MFVCILKQEGGGSRHGEHGICPSLGTFALRSQQPGNQAILQENLGIKNCVHGQNSQAKHDWGNHLSNPGIICKVQRLVIFTPNIHTYLSSQPASQPLTYLLITYLFS